MCACVVCAHTCVCVCVFKCVEICVNMCMCEREKWYFKHCLSPTPPGTLIDLQNYLRYWAKSNLTTVAEVATTTSRINKNSKTSKEQTDPTASEGPASTSSELYSKLCEAMSVDSGSGELLSSECCLVYDGRSEIQRKLRHHLQEAGVDAQTAEVATQQWDTGVKLNKEQKADLLTPIGNVREMLLDLKDTFPLANFGVATADTLDNTIPALTHLGAADLFESVVCDDSIPESKPSPQVIAKVQEDLLSKDRKYSKYAGDYGSPSGVVAVGGGSGKGEEAELASYSSNFTNVQTVMVGDSTHDIRMANSAGCISVGVLTGVHTHAELTAEKADFVISDVTHLPKLARSWLC